MNDIISIIGFGYVGSALASVFLKKSKKIYGIDNDKTKIEKIILIDVPTQIYGDLRKIFINLFENSGFKDIKINETVDFEKLYNTRKIQ